MALLSKLNTEKNIPNLIFLHMEHSFKLSFNLKTSRTLELLDSIQSGKYVHRFYRVYATRRVISPISPCYLVRPGG